VEVAKVGITALFCSAAGGGREVAKVVIAGGRRRTEFERELDR